MKKHIIILISLLIGSISLFAQTTNNHIPSSLLVSSIDQNSAILSWDRDTNVAFWIVSYNVPLASEVTTRTTTDTLLQIINLVPGTQYSWRVSSVDDNGDTSLSVEGMSFYTLGYSSSCANVESVLVGDMNDSYLTLQWQADTSISSYEVVIDDIGTNPYISGTRHTTNNQEYNFYNLTPHSLYQFAVRSHCSNSYSNWKYLYAKYLNSNSIMNLPIQINFEDTIKNHNIGLISSQNNPWIIGSSENSDLSSLGHALYVSNTNGQTATFNNNLPAISYAYLDFNVPESAVSFYIDFKYKSSLTNNKGMKVYLVSNGSSLSLDSLPNSIYQVGNTIYNNTNNLWQQEHIELPSAYVGSTRRILFTWTNDTVSSSVNTSLALDNIYLTARYCAVPDSLIASYISTTSAMLSWNMTSNQQNYNIQYKKVNDTVWNTISNVEDNYLLYNLLPSTTYLYRVQGNCISEESFYSEIDTFTTHAVVNYPTNITAIPTDTSAVVSWNHQNEASKYLIAYKNNIYNASWIIDTSITNSITLNPLSQNTEYLLKIKTINLLNDTSAWSDTLIFSTICSSIEDYPFIVSGIIDYNTTNGFINLPTCWQTNGDSLISPTFNLTPLASGVLTFSHLNNTPSSLYISTDNGLHYSLLKSYLAINTFSFDTIYLSTYNTEQNIRFLFVPTPIHDSITIFRLRNFSIKGQCTPPQNIFVDSVTLSSIYVSWSNESGANSWQVKLKSSSGNTLSSINTSYNNHIFTGLDSISTYIIEIRSLCNGIVSNDSSQVYATTLGTMNVTCQPPAAFHAYWFQTKGDETIIASWTAEPQNNIWQVVYKELYAMSWDTTLVTISPIFTIRNLNIGQVFCIKARSICSPGDTSAFTNIDTVYVGNSSLSSIDENNSNITIYPNPTTGILYINSNNLTIENITLTNTMGQTLERFSTMPKQINLSSREKGVYFINYTINNIKYYKKVILQ
jgi:hypothetical protein